MLGAVDWANLHVAGAFILGAVLGAVAVLRLTRIVAEFLRRTERRNGSDGAGRPDEP